ncbi:MAG: SUMF1/EgtB/PvdO family nonheme iron enzyme [Muribaculaceae bacterium]|nr:SUMF1/EgtB/PvdO family nonheme iron enzyme [Muribaculaceae bacterium]
MNTKRFLLAMGAVLMLSLPMSANRWDVNGDGAVTAADITAVYDKLLNGDNTFPETAYDVNRDGAVTAADITDIYDVLLNGMPSDITEYTVNGVTFAMVNVEGGTFSMGNPDYQSDEDFYNEGPVHQVTVSSFSIGQTEVTQELWQAVMGWNYSGHGGNLQYPAEYITWSICQEFIAKLNEMTGKNFRLPTEAEWEFAARGGNKSNGYQYAGSNDIDEIAWYTSNSGGATHEVGTKAPNELGIYDMSGNVWEWCSDWYGEYSADAQVDPTGPESGAEKVMRGGSWYGKAKKCRVAKRFKAPALFGDDDIGLRLAM